MSSAKLTIDGKDYEFPTLAGTEGEVGIDISALRTPTGAITYDPGLGNTGLWKSRSPSSTVRKEFCAYRGYPIEQLAETAAFSEVAYLLIFGELPDRLQLADWRRKLTYHSMIHEDMKKFFEGFPPTGASDGDAFGDGFLHVHLLSRRSEGRSRPEHGAAAGEAQDDRGVCVQEVDRPAVHLSANDLSYCGELPAR